MSARPDTSIDQAPQEGAGGPAGDRSQPVRLLPIAVMVVSADRCFRAAATMLLSRRGCAVASAADAPEAVSLAADLKVDVVVAELVVEAGHVASARALAAAIDRNRGAAGRRVAPVGLVVVGEREALGDALDAEAGAALPVLDKWGPFARLYQAICDRDGARRLPPPADGPAWPGALRRRGAV